MKIVTNLRGMERETDDVKLFRSIITSNEFLDSITREKYHFANYSEREESALYLDFDFDFD